MQSGPGSEEEAAELRPHHTQVRRRAQGIWRTAAARTLTLPRRSPAPPPLRFPGLAPADARLAGWRARRLRSGGMEQQLQGEANDRESAVPRGAGAGAGAGRGREQPPYHCGGDQGYDWRGPRGHLGLGLLCGAERNTGPAGGTLPARPGLGRASCLGEQGAAAAETLARNKMVFYCRPLLSSLCARPSQDRYVI